MSSPPKFLANSATPILANSIARQSNRDPPLITTVIARDNVRELTGSFRPGFQTVNDTEGDSKPTPVPLSATARRVLGVLVEKAKTTPDNYPMSLAAIVTASNQKSNRSPKMDVDDDDVLVALDELRNVGAAREVHGSGRVVKYRHAAYEWMDIDGPQSAVMTELLLRGPQTVGEIRTRASRMHNLPDLDTAKRIVDSLVEKGLIEPLTPPGRGQLFTHTLYPPQDRQYLLERINKDLPEEPKSPTPDEAKSVVNQLLSRLDAVNERIASLEKRMSMLEGSDE